MEVAQVARRTAEKLIRDQPAEAQELGVDADVVEAAALAHDLGHPPFGHLAEQVLDELLPNEGFEGNPQSFRIVTSLAVGSHGVGLNLTRATLNAILKYPWIRQMTGFKKKKWGCYSSETEHFKWARELYDESDQRKSAEAELMDWADDIAYSIHDVEDFYRARLIPLDRLQADDQERERFYQEVFRRWDREGRDPKFVGRDKDLKSAFSDLAEWFPVSEPYDGRESQRTSLRELTSSLIRKYVCGVKLNVPKTVTESRVTIDDQQLLEIAMLKQLTWSYVIENPALASQQHGQKQIIRDLFRIFSEAADSDGDFKIFPAGVREQVEAAGRGTPAARRIVVDLVASMTEQQALQVHQRLRGFEGGSIFDNPLL